MKSASTICGTGFAWYQRITKSWSPVGETPFIRRWALIDRRAAVDLVKAKGAKWVNRVRKAWGEWSALSLRLFDSYEELRHQLHERSMPLINVDEFNASLIALISPTRSCHWFLEQVFLAWYHCLLMTADMTFWRKGWLSRLLVLITSRPPMVTTLAHIRRYFTHKLLMMSK